MDGSGSNHTTTEPTGKRESTGKSKSKTSRSSRRDDVDDDDRKAEHDLKEQLDSAEEVVRKAKFSTVSLHTMWRTYLFRLSWMVAFLSFHQAQKPTTNCTENIKAFNALEDIPDENLSRIGGPQAVGMIVKDAFPEILGIVISALLAAFLQYPVAQTFANPYYMLAALLIPMQIALFFQEKKIGCVDVLRDFAKTSSADGMAILWEDNNSMPLPHDSEPRQFPVTVIFHVIVTGAYWFMEFHMNQRNKDIIDVIKLRKKLEQMVEKNKQTKKKKHLLAVEQQKVARS